MGFEACWQDGRQISSIHLTNFISANFTSNTKIGTGDTEKLQRKDIDIWANHPYLGQMSKDSAQRSLRRWIDAWAQSIIASNCYSHTYELPVHAICHAHFPCRCFCYSVKCKLPAHQYTNSLSLSYTRTHTNTNTF